MERAQNKEISRTERLFAVWLKITARTMAMKEIVNRIVFQTRD